MRHHATLVGVGLTLLCSVAVFAQGGGAAQQGAANQPYVPPAFDTYTPNIPGVVTGGTRVELITDQLNGTEGPITLVYSPQGRHLGTIPTSRQVQNLAFAGPDKKTLYLVGRNAAWKIQTLTQGYQGRAK